MTIRWDPILTAAIAAELNDALSGARLKGIFLDHGAGTLHAYFREMTVFVDLGRSGLGVELLDKSEVPEGSRTFPCRLSAVEHIPDERVLVFVLTRIRGRGGVIRIVVEFVPNRSNATVVEGRRMDGPACAAVTLGDSSAPGWKPLPKAAVQQAWSGYASGLRGLARDPRTRGNAKREKA